MVGPRGARGGAASAPPLLLHSAPPGSVPGGAPIFAEHAALPDSELKASIACPYAEQGCEWTARCLRKHAHDHVTNHIKACTARPDHIDSPEWVVEMLSKFPGCAWCSICHRMRVSSMGHRCKGAPTGASPIHNVRPTLAPAPTRAAASERPQLGRRSRHLYSKRPAPSGVIDNTQVVVFFECAQGMVAAIKEAAGIEKRMENLAVSDAERRAECLSQLRSAEARAIRALERMGTVTDRPGERGVGPPAVPLPSEFAASLAGAEVVSAAAQDAVPVSLSLSGSASAASPRALPPPSSSISHLPSLPLPPAAAAGFAAAQSEDDLVAKAINSSLHHMRNGLRMGIRRSINKLENIGPKPPVNEASVAKIVELFPPPVDEALSVEELRAAKRCTATTAHDVVFSVASVGTGINNKRSDSAPGMSGLSARVVKQCWHRGTETLRGHLIDLLSILGNAHVPWAMTDFLYAANLLKGVQLPKPNSDAIRPIGIAEILVNIANSIVAKACRTQFGKVCGGNLAIGVPGGSEVMANAVRAALAADDKLIAVHLDIINAFGTASRRILIRQLVKDIEEGHEALIPVLRNALSLFYSGCSIHFSYSSGEGAATIPFRTGFFQGGALCAPWCAIVLKVLKARARERITAELGEEATRRVCDPSFADDTILLVRLPHFEPVVRIYEGAVAEGTGGCSRAKMVVHRRCRSDAEHLALCDILDSMNYSVNKVPYRDLTATDQGVTVAGANIGTVEYETAKLGPKRDRVLRLISRLQAVADAAPLSPTRQPIERTRQTLFIIAQLVVQARFTYFTRVNTPAVAEPMGRQIDERLYDFIERLLGVSAPDLCLVKAVGQAAVSLQRRLLRILFELPTDRGGLGFHPVSGDHAHAARLASLADTANRVRGLVWRMACVPVPDVADAPDVGPAGQPFLPAVIADALASTALLRRNRPDMEGALAGVMGALDSAIEAEHAEQSDFTGTQAVLVGGIYDSEQNFLLRHGMPSMYYRLVYRSNCDKTAAAWRCSIPAYFLGNQIPDAAFLLAMRNLLFQRATPGLPEWCAACATAENPLFIPFDDHHIITCRSAAHGKEHDGIRNALVSAVGPALRNVGAGSAVGETFYNTITGLDAVSSDNARLAIARRDFEHRGEVSSLPSRVVRADAVFTALPEPDAIVADTYLIDFTATSPASRYLNQVYIGDVLERKLKDISMDYTTTHEDNAKRKAFHTTFRIAPGHRIYFVPFPLERSGFLGTAAQKFLATAGHLLDIHEAVGTGRQRTRRNLVEVISVAWQAGLGAKMSRALQRHRANLPELRRRQQLQADDPQYLRPIDGRFLPAPDAPVGAPFPVGQPAVGAAEAATA